MRILIATTLVLAALSAGCSSSAPPPPAAPVAPTIANAITGTVMLRDPRELGAGAKIDLKVVDVAQPDVVLAQTTIADATKLPVSFNLPIDVAKVDPKRTYAIESVLTDGDRRFLPVLQYPVLTNKAPAKVDIQLAPEPTPAEKMYEEYRKAFAQTGTLKSISGSSLNDASTTAWDAFLSNGKVKVMREITELDDDKGRITYKMAYQNDKPWVVVREDAPAHSNHAYATTKVGWSEDGSLVLKEKSANNQTSEVSADDAKAMFAHAQAALDMSQGRAPPPKKTVPQTDTKKKHK
jgi:uncharacterized lipoprotein YbaY